MVPMAYQELTNRFCVGLNRTLVILTVCYAAGLRISEAIGLKPAAIDSQRMDTISRCSTVANTARSSEKPKLRPNPGGATSGTPGRIPAGGEGTRRRFALGRPHAASR